MSGAISKIERRTSACALVRQEQRHRRTMYAVIETGGKQYRVELGSELAIERLDAAPGETIRFERVLLVADGDGAQIGTPVVADALVTGEVVRQDRGEKIIVFKYRPKARHRAKKGHRQEQTVIRVADISINGRSAAEEAGAQEKEQQKARRAAAAAAEKKAAADQELAAKLAQEQADREAKSESATKPAASESTAAPKTAPKTTAAKKPASKATASSRTAKPETKSTTTKAPSRRTSTKKDE
jgi:large subunit ribosomal protein L21